MRPGAPGTDMWHATVAADKPGAWTFAIEAWSDPMGTWHHAVTAKIEAGQGAADLANDLEDGARLFERLAPTLAKDDQARAHAAAAIAARHHPRRRATGSAPRSMTTCSDWRRPTRFAISS